jgi:hypothetical protein
MTTQIIFGKIFGPRKTLIETKTTFAQVMSVEGNFPLCIENRHIARSFLGSTPRQYYNYHYD